MPHRWKSKAARPPHRPHARERREDRAGGLGVDLQERLRDERGLEHATESMSAGPRRLIFRAVRCPMQSTAGSPSPPARRSVGERSNAVCREATTQSRRQRLVVNVERAVCADVHLDPLQDPEAASRSLSPSISGPEPPASRCAGSASGRSSPGTSSRGSSPGRPSPRPSFPSLDQVELRVQIAAEVGQLDELRKLALAGSLELAQVLAQLRRDVLVAEELRTEPPRPPS